MSLSDSLYVSLRCPNTGEEKKESLQLFLRNNCAEEECYEIGSVVKLDKSNTLWFSTDYVCNQCSSKVKTEFGHRLIQSRHRCYIYIEKNRILEVITEQEYKQRKLPSCPDQDYYYFEKEKRSSHSKPLSKPKS